MLEEHQRSLGVFVEACNDMIRSNFILAKSKLDVVFKTIASDENLKQFFENAVDGYQFKMAKTKCIASTVDGRRLRQIILLPETEKEKVAFLFCLLVEITKDKIDIVTDNISFDAFLIRFFGPESDFEKCYISFCEQIVIPFRDSVVKAFDHPFSYYGEELSSAYLQDSSYETDVANTPTHSVSEVSFLRQRKIFADEMGALVEEERSLLGSLPLSERQYAIASRMIEELSFLCSNGEISTIKAVLWGYHYLLLYAGASSKTINRMYECIAQYEENSL